MVMVNWILSRISNSTHICFHHFDFVVIYGTLIGLQAELETTSFYSEIILLRSAMTPSVEQHLQPMMYYKHVVMTA